MKSILVFALAISIVFSCPGVSFLQEGNKISLDIKGMDILDVLKILSMRSDLNIIAGKNVRGNVTMFLKDVDIWDAFEIILAANELAYEKQGNIINVMTQRDYELIYGEKYRDKKIAKTVKLKYARVEDVAAALSQIKTNIGKVVPDEPSRSVVLMDIPSKVEEMEKIILSLDAPMITKVYKLQYAKAEDMKDKITEMLTKNVGSLRIDERTNKIAITDIEKKIEEFDKVLIAFDERHKEVEIEAMILELSLNDEYRAGIDWDVAFQQLGGFLNKTLGDHAFSFNFSQALTTGVTYGIGDFGRKGFQAVLQFLEHYGSTRILSNPRITVVNNEEAKILVGTNQPYVTQTLSQGETTTEKAYNVTFLDLGVKLTVTPTINDDGFITMKVKPEVSSSSDALEYGEDADSIPIVDTSTTETTVMVKDKNTIMLSGLIQKRDEFEEEKVPLLGNIPILGALFKSTSRGNASTTSNQPERKEIIIFLTPHIIYGEDEGLLEEVRGQREKEKSFDQALQEMQREQSALKQDRAIKIPAEEEQADKKPDYYQLVWGKINKRTIHNRPKMSIPGEATVSFILSSDGNLVGEPLVFASQDADPQLIEIVLKSVKEAAPFEPFPETMQEDSEVFNISISYD
ncbi:MAG: secretin N-terminal domain-containing protein [Candidatus Omnitrophota bacterium]